MEALLESEAFNYRSSFLCFSASSPDYSRASLLFFSLLQTAALLDLHYSPLIALFSMSLFMFFFFFFPRSPIYYMLIKSTIQYTHRQLWAAYCRAAGPRRRSPGRGFATRDSAAAILGILPRPSCLWCCFDVVFPLWSYTKTLDQNFISIFARVN